jgi:hypothetical protein
MERRLVAEDQRVHKRVIISQFSQEVAAEVTPRPFIRGFQLLQNL